MSLDTKVNTFSTILGDLNANVMCYLKEKKSYKASLFFFFLQIVKLFHC